MIIGLKANVAEIAATYQAAYPQREDSVRFGERLFDRQPRAFLQQHQEQRLRLCHYVARQFGKIPQSPELQQRHPASGADTVEENLASAAPAGKERIAGDAERSGEAQA